MGTLKLTTLIIAWLSQSQAFSLNSPKSSISLSSTYPNPTSLHANSKFSSKLFARRPDRNRRNDNDDDYYGDDDDYYYDDEDYYERPRRRRRRGGNIDIDNDSEFNIDKLSNENNANMFNLPSPFSSNNNNSKNSWRLPESLSTSLFAGVFLLGIGTGVTVDSAINTNPKDLASRDAIDRQAPNPTLCTAYGASAMAFDQRVFVSFNPFNVYVAQADVKPACVLRPENVAPVLKQQTGLLNEREIQSCKKNMNTWAFVGDLQDMPQLSCVYKSEDAQNEFVSNPKLGIGEDVWDDDREKATKLLVNPLTSSNNQNPTTKKIVKDVMTESQIKKQVQMNMDPPITSN